MMSKECLCVYFSFLMFFYFIWWSSCKLNHIILPYYLSIYVCRAGLVIGHTGHFPGGPTHFRGWQNVFFFINICQGASRRDSEQPVAHWFVSCIDSVNHPITMRYRRRNEVFCSAPVHTTSDTQRQSDTIPFISMESWRFPATRATASVMHQDEAAFTLAATLSPRAGDEVASGRSHYWLPWQQIRFLALHTNILEAKY